MLAALVSSIVHCTDGDGITAPSPSRTVTAYRAVSSIATVSADALRLNASVVGTLFETRERPAVAGAAVPRDAAAVTVTPNGPVAMVCSSPSESIRATVVSLVLHAIRASVTERPSAAVATALSWTLTPAATVSAAPLIVTAEGAAPGPATVVDPPPFGSVRAPLSAPHARVVDTRLASAHAETARNEVGHCKRRERRSITNPDSGEGTWGRQAAVRTEKC